MSTMVTRGHGGDAGGDPPAHSDRIPTSCEAQPKQKKMRGISTSKNLDGAYEANRSMPLPILFDIKGETYRPVGPNANMFVRYIGNLIGVNVPLHHPSWDHVPPRFKTSIILRLKEFFILDQSLPQWPMIRAGIERECQDLYRDRKSKLKKYFDNVGGYTDVENARRNPPPQIDNVAWGELVDLFLDPKYINRSTKNAENRKHMKYPSLHGTASYAAIRHKKKNPQTQELPGQINTWHDMHYKPSDGWVNDLARVDYEAMLAEKVAQTQHDSTTSSSINEAEIITKVLGESRGHKRGLGRKLKGSSFLSFSEPPQPPSHDTFKYVVDTLNKAFSQYSHHLVDILRRAHPGQEFPPPPTIDTEALFASDMARQQPTIDTEALFASDMARQQPTIDTEALFASDMARQQSQQPPVQPPRNDDETDLYDD